MWLIALLIMHIVASAALDPVQTIISCYNQHDFDRLYNTFSNSLKAAVPADQFRSLMYNYYAQTGQLYDYKLL